MINQLKQKLRMAYDQQMVTRDKRATQDWKVKERETFYSYLVKEKKTSLLEIGAGAGRDSLFFKNKGFQTMSTDISANAIQLCREKGLEAKVMSFDHLEFPDESFDAVYALNCLLHVPKAELPEVLYRVRRVLKPDGLFYMGVYGGNNSEGIWEEDDYEPKRFFSFFDDTSLQYAVSKTFDIVYFKTIPKDIIGGDLAFQSMLLRNVHR
ncbi:hypothetical protein GCM10011391_19390 [Pullulanibacillus camelliae]|uniref:Methyltransferase type 11 domain-containing protein n=1 Tax=Pullulanibacillus camelliae TaxID=1707096 RepID=A0A8J2W282_9BACL|nr:class I SAM-dependent methyltransferase [Pullulanibacillus camelliae]GGE40721.1 hypothetical protein GCM10011391_19390 [Pullulanibacillus camelliae]